MTDYKQIATDARKKVLELIYKAQVSHVGSNFSCIDIMAVLFEKMDLNTDQFVLSAGWKAASLYYFLWRKGRITEEELDSFCQKVECSACHGTGIDKRGNTEGTLCKKCEGTGKIWTKFIGLTEPNVCKDILIGAGSMGLGLPGAVGLALAKKMKEEQGKVYCLMSDGEMQIGTTWESMLIARQHNLDNLIVIVDNNGFQAMGRTKDILCIPFLAEQSKTLGWMTAVLDGHDFNQMARFWDTMLSGQDDNGKTIKNFPWFIIANTIKGKGVSFMENNNLYHYKQLSQEEKNNALKELVYTII